MSAPTPPPPPGASRPSRGRAWGTVGKLVAALVATGVLGAGLLLPYVGGLGLAAGHEADKFLSTTCNLTESQPPLPTTIYADDGTTVIAKIFTEDRDPIPLTQVPKYLQEALIATEDRRFYSHHGVDLRGLIRSAVNTSNGDTQGGSTLTMQYVKQTRYYQAVETQDPTKEAAAVAQNLNRKMEDAQCALQIEKRESKPTILDNYLNIAFFGENSYGIERAAENYFGVHASQLTLPESALLVGILRAPTSYDPFINPVASKQRRNEVIQNLVDVHDLTQAQADAYEATPIQLATTAAPPVREGCAASGSTIPNVGFFCEYVTNWLTSTGGIKDLATGGYSITTTLNPALQASAQQGISAAVPATSPMTAVLPVLDPKTGDVLAMVSSKLYGNAASPKDNTHTSLPIFTSYTAPGSSTYKLFPLLVALSTGIPSTWPLEGPTTPTGTYLPSNCTTDAPVSNGDALESYAANETLQSATAKSSNTYFVALVDQLLDCNLGPVLNLAKQLGMNGLQQNAGEPDAPKLTYAQTISEYQRAAELVLGDVPTSPLELTAAYAAVANDGFYNAPAPVREITNSAGEQVSVKRSQSVPVVAPQVARQAVQILSGDTQAASSGTSASAFGPWYAANPSIVAGKTGTSVAVVNGKDTSQNASVWFVGMTPKYVATSALINFSNPFVPSSGLPGVADGTAYGAYASGVWLKALQPTLATQQWGWPSPQAAGNLVPVVTGQPIAAAKAAVTAAGYKFVAFDAADQIQCPSSVPYGSVAYYAPQQAPAGSTIYYCPSAGVQQQIYKPPPPKPKPTPTKSKTPAPGSHPSSGPHGSAPAARPPAAPPATHPAAPASGAAATQ